MTSLHRRRFIASASAMGAAAVLPSRRLLAAGSGEQVNLGVVGCGWRGGQLMDYFQKTTGCRIAGLCDVDQKLLDALGQKVPQANKWADMRHMFDSPEIDAVLIATCNHWHCLAAIWAMQAGKHVYVEKPLGHTQWEGEQVVRASEKYNRICQVGTQQRSDPMQAEIKQFLHEEKLLGEIESVRVNRFGVRKPIGRLSEPLIPPKSVDFGLWLGPAREQPIYREKLHYDWHWDWNTGSGEMGNWGVHILDDVRNNVFLDKVAAPHAVTAAGGRFAWGDAGNTPNVHFAILAAAGVPVTVTLSNLPLDQSGVKVPGPQSGYIAYCTNGRLAGQRGRAAAFDRDGKLIKKFKGGNGDGRHQQNFIDAIRENEPKLLKAPARVGNDSTAWCNLINIATRMPPTNDSGSTESLTAPVGPMSAASVLDEMRAIIAVNSTAETASQLQLGPALQFDTEHGQFVGQLSEFANPLLRRDYRKSFEVLEV